MTYWVYFLQPVISGDKRKRWYRGRKFEDEQEAIRYGEEKVENHPNVYAYKIK